MLKGGAAMLYSAIDISKYVINRSYDINFRISNLELQKILYYIQAAFLVEKNKSCFGEKILAWEYGPVIREVYDEYKVCGRSRIPRQNESKKPVFNFETFEVKLKSVSLNIDEMDKIIINKILDAYSDVTDPFELVRKTHSEDPWKKGRASGVISEDDMKVYYSNNLDKLYNIRES